MNSSSDPRSLLATGNPAGALRALQQQVRSRADDPKLRIFLFQLLAVLGQWQRALDQLKVCGELDAGSLAMVATYGPALQCESVRAAVFTGRTAPHVFGPPSQWMALLVQALQFEGEGHAAQAADACAAALNDAPASAGTVNGAAFEWIADADSRIGPALEAIIDGRYGWLPFEHVRRLRIEPVTDLRDLVWAPAQVEFANGGPAVALLPVRYAGSAETGDALLQLARKTVWQPLGADGGQFRGLGQRVIATDSAEIGLLELREIVIRPNAAEAA